MKASELINIISNLVKSKGDLNVEVFSKGEIFPVKEINFVEKDGVIEIGCGWNTVDEEREEEYISDIHKRGW